LGQNLGQNLGRSFGNERAPVGFSFRPSSDPDLISGSSDRRPDLDRFSNRPSEQENFAPRGSSLDPLRRTTDWDLRPIPTDIEQSGVSDHRQSPSVPKSSSGGQWPNRDADRHFINPMFRDLIAADSDNGRFAARRQPFPETFRPFADDVDDSSFEPRRSWPDSATAFDSDAARGRFRENLRSFDEGVDDDCSFQPRPPRNDRLNFDGPINFRFGP
jgi:hypothetical protein